MGTVYRGREKNDGKDIAIKVVRPDIFETVKKGEALARFERETNVQQSLRHVRIAQLLERHIEEEDPYFVMEYVDGPNLTEVADVKPLRQFDIAEVVDIGIKVAEALVFAHGHSKIFIHRDLKLDNIILTADRSDVRLVDFGIAKALLGSKTDFRSRTVAGQKPLVGTPASMAPEVWRGSDPTPKVDVWSLGVVLYELVSGKDPFPGATHAVISFSVLNEPPTDLEKIRPDIPPALKQLIMDCLEKNPDNRPATDIVVERLRAIHRLDQVNDQ